MEGYGLYWLCLELIAHNVDKDKLNFELEHDAEIIAADTGIHQDRISEMMSYMVNLGLFENSNGIITCLKMLARTDEYTQKLIKLSGGIGPSSRESPDIVGTKSVLDKIRLDEIRTDKTLKTISKTSSSHPPVDTEGPSDDFFDDEEPKPVKADKCPYAQIIDLYHEILPDNPKVKMVTDKRRAHIRARWLGIMDKDANQFKGYFGAVKRSKFLCGKVPAREGFKHFIADFDFLMRESTCIGVMEGKYER